MTASPRPCLASDFATLASVAVRLHADRFAALPPEDPRVATMASIAAILNAARHGRAIGAVAVTWAALRTDLADTNRRAADRATRARGDLQAQETAEALAAIAWHFEPVSPAIDTPQIVFCQTTTLAIRAKLAADRAAPAPSVVPQPIRSRSVQAGPLFGAAA